MNTHTHTQCLDQKPSNGIIVVGQKNEIDGQKKNQTKNKSSSSLSLTKRSFRDGKKIHFTL